MWEGVGGVDGVVKEMFVCIAEENVFDWVWYDCTVSPGQLNIILSIASLNSLPPSLPPCISLNFGAIMHFIDTEMSYSSES